MPEESDKHALDAGLKVGSTVLDRRVSLGTEAIMPHAASQAWLIVQNDGLKPTTAGLAAA